MYSNLISSSSGVLVSSYVSHGDWLARGEPVGLFRDDDGQTYEVLTLHDCTFVRWLVAPGAPFGALSAVAMTLAASSVSPRSVPVAPLPYSSPFALDLAALVGLNPSAVPVAPARSVGLYVAPYQAKMLGGVRGWLLPEMRVSAGLVARSVLSNFFALDAVAAREAVRSTLLQEQAAGVGAGYRRR